MCLMYGVDVVLTRSRAAEGVVRLYGVAEQIVDDYAAACSYRLPMILLEAWSMP
jgi:hypothetical protein